MTAPILEVEGLSRSFAIRRGPLKRVVRRFNAVEDVSFVLETGEALGIVGESGCGKSTLAKMLVTALRPSEGRILLTTPEGSVDVATADRDQLRRVRNDVQMVFQDPYSSLNPRMPVAAIVGEPLYVNRGVRGKALRSEVAELLEMVGLNPKLMDRFPHAFSGGQRQRIGLARALALRPKVLVADEPVSALDVSIQAQVLELMQRLRRELNLTFIFISHDLGVVQHLCDRVLVMYCGRIVETRAADRLFSAPRHPYVETLLAAAPTLVPGSWSVRAAGGEIADPANRPSGCAYHPRCPYAEAICHEQRPALVPDDGGLTACHLAERLTLRGVTIDDDGDRRRGEAPSTASL